MIREQRIEEFEMIWELISKQPYDNRIDRHRSSYLYRGLSNASFKLETSLSRNCKGKAREVETPILRNFAKYASIEDPQLSNSVWRQLIIGQHHGLPTRLLDWTYSPLIALHFATSGEDLFGKEIKDSVIWEINIEEFNSLLPSEYKDQLGKESAFLFTVDMLDKVVQRLEQYDTDMNDRAMVLIEPPSIDQRIINQYSYFSIVPQSIQNIEDFLEKYTDCTTKYIIDSALKWRIRDMLDQLNINERIVFPGLDGIAAWLKRHYYVQL